MTSLSPTTTSEWTTGDAAFSQSLPLGARLVASGLVTSEQIREALNEQRLTGLRLGEILITNGVLFETDLAQVVSAMFGMPYRDLDLHPPDPSVLNQIPEAFCRRRNVLPLEFENGALVVAVTDPSDIQTIDDLKLVVTPPIRPVFVGVTPEQLRRAITTSFQSTGASTDESSPAAELAQANRSTDISDPAATGNPSPSLEEPVVRFVNQLFRRAIEETASDIHVEPTQEGLRIRFRVDGMLYDVMTAPPALRMGVISRIKIMTGMDITEHRRPQDGRVSMTARGLSVDVRAASLPTVYGEALVLRLLNKDQGLLDINELSFLPDSLSRYRKSFRKPWGLILVTGPTGSGKSTTLYATVSELNLPTRNTITVEDPIEYRVAGIKQTQVNLKAGYTFASGLRASLRADPDIILIGEIRDLETARISAEAALTGHLVLSTLHANDAASSTTRLIEMGLEPYLVTSSLECVVAQRLLRRLCLRCRTEEVASGEDLLELKAMSLVEDTSSQIRLFRANGCAQCGRSGYRGRLAVHEVLVMDDRLKALVLERAPGEKIAQAAVEGGMQTLQQDAFVKVLAGDTSLDECKRVLA